jgi:16S rRNA processing protein RimM
MLLIARFGAPYGVKGWLKLHSFAHPKEQILQYGPFYLQKGSNFQELTGLTIQAYRDEFIAQVADINDRDNAIPYVNCDLYMKDEQLPKCPAGQFYWHQLIGLQVINRSGYQFGVVDHLIYAGQDVLCIQNETGEVMIPFVQGVTILKVDLAAKQIVVDWEADY